MNSLKIISIALILLWCQHLESKEYHVSVSGADDAPGTRVEPFRSISFAARLALPGDTITVHEGIYREMVVPAEGGSHDLMRILYRAAPGEKAVIKGSEIISEWKKVKGSVWKAEIPNAIFGDYNPYTDVLEGDWLNSKGFVHHTGEVFLNGKSLFEKNSLDDVKASDPYPDARDQEASTYTWNAEVKDGQTTIWANFQEYDPNEEEVEINVRPSCFYPDRPGINFITIRGFVMDQAATQWAAPTAEQIGLIGTHWSKGWIIEDNVISNSKAVGITLGKDRFTGQNVWMNNPVKDGATHYNEVIFRALEIGWSKEKIGSHLVRNNVIFDCGQAGIVGSLGGVFSTICNNHIYDIWTRRIWSGAEMGGIKIHASIDMLIKNNRIHNTGRGLWIDWMAQGTRVTGNLFYDNTTDDIFSEVNHGPYLVDNNILLSKIAIRDWSEGGAYVHNLIAGHMSIRKVPGRFTPYHLPHSTKVAGLRNIYLGDNRFFNNIFIKTGPLTAPYSNESILFYGLDGYQSAGFESQAFGNVYYNGAIAYEKEQDPIISEYQASVEWDEDGESVFLTIDLDGSMMESHTQLVTTGILGSTIVSEAIFENRDGSPYVLDLDYFGKQRDREKVIPGPIDNIASGTKKYQIW